MSSSTNRDPRPGAERDTKQAPTDRLLVVDDDATSRELLRRFLERADFEVLTASSGSQALSLLERESVELVLLDIMMGTLSGLDVLARLRRRHNQIELPVIMTTAISDSSTVVEALDLGANDYLTKPIDFPVAIARIRSQLAAARLVLGESPRPLLGSADPESLVGLLLGGKYRLEQLIGTGAIGAVYRARHDSLGKRVAVKLLLETRAGSPEWETRFRREARAACTIDHPNVVEVLDIDVTDRGVPYLVMELLEGITLQQLIKRQRKLDAVRCVSLLLPIFDVLSKAHSLGLIHRDLKPGNIFIQSTPHGEVVKLLDFGLAKLAQETADQEAEITRSDQLLGTPTYMAPESLRGDDCDGRVDVYAMGVMIYQLLTGRLPFSGRRGHPMSVALKHLHSEPVGPAKLEPSIPQAVEALVLWALSKRAEERPSMASLGRNLAVAVGLKERLGGFPKLIDGPADSGSSVPGTDDEPTVA